ncbi:MAG: isoleucine--tRNA ligase, partial [Candidatus Binataceae bacterium]
LKVDAKYYIVAARLAEAVAEAISKEAGLRVEKTIALDRVAIHALDGQDIFRHPFLARDAKLMYAEHVTADTGTGLVHTAPGHGYEDFVVGAKYGIEPFTPVDGAGVFTAEGGQWAGRNVFEANDSIVARVRETGALLAAHTISHSYPHCWRCHKPLIFRATEQWFLRIDHEDLRAKVIGAIDGAKWFPGWSRDRIRNMTETRPDWNLSRQRAWGVPIPALRCTRCGNVILDSGVMKIAEEIFVKESSDAWFERPVADFAPAGLACPKCSGTAFSKEEDVLDVWFDSGCSQAAVLAIRPELQWPADAYLEAVEQARGWFSSSLTCAVAQRGAAPFRAVISHGLTVDERGRKMSKSLGNTEDAHEVADRLGADVIRLVYASLDYTSEIALGPTIFAAVSESYRKIRNTCRYILGNFSDFDPARDMVAYPAMLEFDRFILARLERLKSEVRHAFENFDFQAAYSALSNFIVVDLSSLYIDVARDRLYCDGRTSASRRSAQTALHQILDATVRMLAPLIPFTADEIYSYVPGRTADSVHLLELQPAHPEWADTALAEKWDRMLAVRDDALKLLEAMRKDGTIGGPLDAVVQISSNTPADAAALKALFIVSDVAPLKPADAAALKTEAAGRDEVFTSDGFYARVSPNAALTARRAPGVKCHRCWCYFDDGGDPELCPRCRAVVRT